MLLTYEQLPQETKNFIDGVVNAIKKYFPYSDVGYKFWAGLGEPSVQFYIYLSKDASECASRIRRNDALRTYFEVYLNSDGSLNGDKTVIQLITGGFCMRIADKNIPKEKFCVYGSVKLPFRKITGTPEKIIAGMEKWALKTATILLENAEAINAGTIKGLFTVQDKVVI